MNFIYNEADLEFEDGHIWAADSAVYCPQAPDGWLHKESGANIEHLAGPCPNCGAPIHLPAHAEGYTAEAW